MELYSELYAYLQPYMHGALRSVIIQSVRLAARKFCRESEAWRYTSTQDSDVDTLTYTFDISAYNSDFLRVMSVRINDSDDVLDFDDYTVSTDRTSITLENYPPSSETDGIEIIIAMVPQYDAEELTEPFFERWSEAIISATKADMYKHPKKPYTDLEQARICLLEYRGFLGEAKMENFRDGRNVDERVNLTKATEMW